MTTSMSLLHRHSYIDYTHMDKATGLGWTTNATAGGLGAGPMPSAFL
ncbi:hypothetical protein [Duncaniella muris]